MDPLVKQIRDVYFRTFSFSVEHRNHLTPKEKQIKSVSIKNFVCVALIIFSGTVGSNADS